MSKVKFSDVVNNIKVNIDREHNPYNHYIAGDHMDTEDIHLRRKGSFETDDVGPAFTRLFKIGQILYGSRRTYLKKAAIADFEGITANTTFVFESRDESIFLTKLLPFLIQSNSFTEWSVKKSKGSTNPYVVFSDLANFEFELPELKIQKEYEDILWKIDNTREAYRNLISSLDKLNKSRFIELFGHTQTNSKNFKCENLGDICENLDSMRVPITSTDRKPGNYPYYGASGIVDMVDDYIFDGDYLLVSEDGANLLARTTPIAFSISGKNWVNNHAHILKFESKSLQLYVEYMLNNSSLTEKITGSAQPKLNQKALNSIKVPMPSNDDLNSFFKLYNQIDKSKFNLKRAIHELDLLTEKITSRLFCLNDKHK